LNASEMIRSHERAGVPGIFVIYYYSLLCQRGLCHRARHFSATPALSLAVRAIAPRNYSRNAKRKDTAVKIRAREWKSEERAALSLSRWSDSRRRRENCRVVASVGCADSNDKEDSVRRPAAAPQSRGELAKELSSPESAINAGSGSAVERRAHASRAESRACHAAIKRADVIDHALIIAARNWTLAC